jgi:hypothetical protein
VCNLLLDGLDNGFTVSTYATPRQILTDYKPDIEKLGPAKALYTCNPKRNPKSLYFLPNVMAVSVSTALQDPFFLA